MTSTTKKRKPMKPQLWQHPNGYWCKKVLGRQRYFGRVADDPTGEAALALWMQQKDDLLAGREPRARHSNRSGLTVVELCNHFGSHKLAKVGGGELAQRTYDRYAATCRFLVSFFGRNRLAEDLRPDDFERLRAAMAKRWGVVALGNEIQMVRSIFRYGFRNELLTNPGRFGSSFEKPSAKTRRMQKHAKGPRMFAAREIRKLLKAAGPNMRAMILLGVNGGLGNTEVAELPRRLLQLRAGWLDYPRAKTGVERRIPLWPETVEAIRDVQGVRRSPKDPQHAGLLFIGRRGESYLGDHRGYRVDQEFKRVAAKAGVVGRSFYDFRRTFQTVGEGSRD
ncbi:MAG: integrase, partial [Planctomycetes bacterium]|nr:integrase [Planctomycetota bacterium]